MDTVELNNLIQKAIKEMEAKNYKEKTIDSEKNTFNCLLKYCKKHNIENYNIDIGFKFLEEHYHLSSLSTKSRPRRVRSIYLLEWVSKGEDITKKVIPRGSKYNPSSSYQWIIDEYTKNLKEKEYSLSTIKGRLQTLSKLFCYCDSKKINDYKDITRDVIYDFINDVKDKYSDESLYTITYRIKNFYDYLYEVYKSDIKGSDIFPRIIRKDREKIPSFYTKEEIVKILSMVDNTTKIGKRDYAVLLLAITYGLRNSDIINLSFNNIDWEHNSINIIQKKTKKMVSLYLTEQVKLSLLDYIKNARPSINSNHVFLKFVFPYEYCGNNSNLYTSVKKYIIMSGIEIKDRKKGLHSMRHSCASNMLNNKTQVPVISSILGHSSTNTTKCYLSIDMEQLKKISLEVPNDDE